ncbi:MAG: VWA domain-containing protein [Anaerolineae bacterium]|nr:VWA domain-containing protein [Anaerolineae bacterium]MBT7783279.1 VWA domain-containing protein [Anaerolineae bacterium]
MEDGEEEEGTPQGEPEAAPNADALANTDANWWEGGKKVAPGEEFKTRSLNTPLDKLSRRQSGRRSTTRTERKQGRYIRATPANGKTNDIAFDATLRAAAPFQKERKEERKKVAFSIKKSDFQKKIRVKKSANFVLFLVDASWSMAVAERMNATKGAILSLLTDAYQRRDRVGLIVFQKDRATLVLSPTNSVQLAQRALVNIPVGGKTPLSAGLLMSAEILKRESYTHPDIEPLLIVMTDGAGNVAIGKEQSPNDEAYGIADKIAKNDIRSIVVNMEHEAFDQGLARLLADHLDAPCFTLDELKAENLYRTVKRGMVG